MPNQIQAFTDHFSYYLPENATAKTRLKKAANSFASYIPIISTIWAICSLAKDASEFREKNVQTQALVARYIIALTGAGILLLPVDLIGTIVKAGRIASQQRQQLHEAKQIEKNQVKSSKQWLEDFSHILREKDEMISNPKGSFPEQITQLESFSEKIYQLEQAAINLSDAEVVARLKLLREEVKPALKRQFYLVQMKINEEELEREKVALQKANAIQPIQGPNHIYDFGMSVLYYMIQARNRLNADLNPQADHQTYLPVQIESYDSAAITAIASYGLYLLLDKATLQEKDLIIDSDQGKSIILNSRGKNVYSLYHQFNRVYQLLHSVSDDVKVSQAAKQSLVRRLAGGEDNTYLSQLSDAEQNWVMQVYAAIYQLQTAVNQRLINRYETNQTNIVPFQQAFHCD